jgi:PAS domain S-box-containing protein
MADLPDRRGVVNISTPWLSSDYFFLVRRGNPFPDRGSGGSIGHISGRILARLVKSQYPHATLVPLGGTRELVKAVCDGRVQAAVFEMDAAETVLREKPPECGAADLRAQPVPGLTMQFGIGATSQARGAAERIRDEIDKLARDGTLLSAMAKYSVFGLSEISATYGLLDLREREKNLSIATASLSVALALTLLMCWFLYRARKATAEAAAAKAEFLTRYSMAARATNDAIWDWDLDTGQVVWSEGTEALFGYQQSDIQPNLSWHTERIHPDDRERVIRGIETTLARAEDKWSDEYRFLCKDNSYAFVVGRGYITYDKAGKPTRLIGAMTDVTPRRLLEEQLRHSQRMEAIGRLAGGVAHDFNNLLTVINGYSDFVLEQIDKHNPLRDQLVEIRKAGERASSLTKQLLTFSRRAVSDRKVVNLNHIITDADKMLRRLLGENIDTIMRLDPAAGSVLADAGEIHQVIMNLAVNARDAMPKGGTLTIETANVELDAGYAGQHSEVRPGSYVLLALSDTGVGMDAETKSHIFEPFFTTKGHGVSTGLGLSTVYGIVKNSGGWIWVYSEPGQGATFKIYLPRADAVAKPTSLAQISRAAGGGTETVLVVEDQEEVRQFAAQVLRSRGYEVLEAPGGKEALVISEHHPGRIHLMLTDVVMPGMTGVDLAETIGPLRPDMKVLYMSGYTNNTVAHRGMDSGDSAYLPKPFSPEILSSRVRETLDSDTATSKQNQVKSRRGSTGIDN